MAEIVAPEIKPATDADLIVASRKPAAAKAPKADAAPVEAPKADATPAAAPPATAPADPLKKDADPAPAATTTPVEKLKAKAKKAETFIKKDIPLSEIPPTQLPDALKAEIEKWQLEASEAKKIINDPDVQIVLELKKTNKDIFSLLDEVKGTDPKTLTPEALYQMDLKEQGLSDEDMESELEEFRELSPAKQKLKTNAMRKQLEAQASDRKQNFLSTLKTGNETASAESVAKRAQQEQAAQKTQNEFLKLCDDYVGKSHYGLTGTPQMAESLKNILKDPNGLIGKNQDGSLNAAELFELAHFKLYKDLLFDELKNSAYAEAFEELGKEFTASGGDTTKVRMPQGADKVTEQEQGKVLLTNAVPVR